MCAQAGLVVMKGLESGPSVLWPTISNKWGKNDECPAAHDAGVLPWEGLQLRKKSCKTTTISILMKTPSLLIISLGRFNWVNSYQYFLQVLCQLLFSNARCGFPSVVCLWDVASFNIAIFLLLTSEFCFMFSKMVKIFFKGVNESFGSFLFNSCELNQAVGSLHKTLNSLGVSKEMKSNRWGFGLAADLIVGKLFNISEPWCPHW